MDGSISEWSQSEGSPLLGKHFSGYVIRKIDICHDSLFYRASFPPLLEDCSNVYSM